MRVPTPRCSHAPLFSIAIVAAMLGGCATNGNAAPVRQTDPVGPGADRGKSERPRPASASTAQRGLHWRGPLAGGSTVEVRGINGDIVLEPTGDNLVEVLATKSGEDADRVDVQFETGVRRLVACVTARGTRGCAPERAGHRQLRDVDEARVDFRVRVPDGLKLVARTINGAIESAAPAASLDLRTVNGSITADVAASPMILRAVNGTIEAVVSAPAQVETVSGALDISLAADVTSGGRIALGAVSGDVLLTLPAEAGAKVRAETLSGEITSCFPLDRRRHRFVGQSATSTVGGGDVDIRINTVSGAIEIARAEPTAP